MTQDNLPPTAKERVRRIYPDAHVADNRGITVIIGSGMELGRADFIGDDSEEAAWEYAASHLPPTPPVEPATHKDFIDSLNAASKEVASWSPEIYHGTRASMGMEPREQPVEQRAGELPPFDETCEAIRAYAVTLDTGAQYTITAYRAEKECRERQLLAALAEVERLKGERGELLETLKDAYQILTRDSTELKFDITAQNTWAAIAKAEQRGRDGE